MTVAYMPIRIATGYVPACTFASAEGVRSWVAGQSEPSSSWAVLRLEGDGISYTSASMLPLPPEPTKEGVWLVTLPGCSTSVVLYSQGLWFWFGAPHSSPHSVPLQKHLYKNLVLLKYLGTEEEYKELLSSKGIVTRGWQKTDIK